VRRVAPIAFIGLLAVSSAAADTIVLKNGRHIIASNVTETADRVSYETPAGTLSLPRSIVDRIVRNDLSPSGFGPSEAPPISAPRLDVGEGYAELAEHVVRSGAIDTALLATLEGEARGGSAEAIAKVAAAHHAAAQFLAAKGQLDAAANQYKRALIFAPDSVPLLLNLAVLDLRQSQYTAALDPLARARRLEPDSADVAKLMGWAYSGANKLDLAVEEWNRALKLRPDAEVTSALAKAKQDRDEEASYREGETAHFSVKYSGAAAPDLARGILRALEDDYRDLQSQLDFSPPEPIGVILYTNQAFADITRAPGWAGALNDGRIRVPVQGLAAVTGELSHVLKHELTHSFITQKTHGRCPTWLQEGVAQFMEGRRSRDSAAALVDAYEHNSAPSFGQMEGSWMGLSGDSAAFSYAWSLAAVEAIVFTGGMSDISRLLDHVATDSSTEAALIASLRMDYAELAHQTSAYLRRNYVR
jgi:tetratricopeptide (TPR) repeat protein